MQQSMQQLQRAGILFPGGVGGAGPGSDFGAGLAGLGNFGNLNLGGGEDCCEGRGEGGWEGSG